MQLILIAMLFAAPVVTAWVAWTFATSEGVGSTTNAGTLVRPARPLTPVSLVDAEGGALPERLLSGRWSYVLFAEAGCDAACLERLYLTRQVRLGVSKDMSRVQRVLVLPQAPAELERLRADHPDLLIAIATGQNWAELKRQFELASDSTFYLVDPLGNLMMRYPAQVPAKGILKDLRKLLKASQVG
jgi:cytochrome oxidase Cu insertion factor (SCO1/SenC/PrrC family)